MRNGRDHRVAKRYITIVQATIFVIGAAAWAFGAESNRWQPLSSTASAITGPVILTTNKLQMAKQSFPLRSGKDVDAAHLGDAAKIADLAEKPSSAKLYRTQVPAATKLLHSNTICGGGQDATWMLAVFSEKSLALAFFSGTNEPPIEFAVTSTGHSLCGTFGYIPTSR